MTILVLAKYNEEIITPIEYELDLGFEILQAQLISIISIDDIIIIDSKGREIKNSLDINDIIEKNENDINVINIYIFDKNIIDEYDICSNRLIQLINSNIDSIDNKVIQPLYHIIDTNIKICRRCSQFFDPSLIVYDNNNTTTNSPIVEYSCQSNQAIDMGLSYDINSIEKLNKEENKYKYLLNTTDRNMNQVLALFMKRVYLFKTIGNRNDFNNIINSSITAKSQGDKSFSGKMASGYQCIMVLLN
jgi:hypothetical protein